MENCVIRLAKTEDCEAVERIMRQVHALHVGWRPDVFSMPERVLPQEAFDKAVDEGRLLVAEAEGEIIGMLLFFARHIEGNGKVTCDMLWADAIGVKEKHRGQGVDRMLLDRLREIAKERGAGSIGLGVYACNDHARRIYEAYGFSERTVNMEMKLEE